MSREIDYYGMGMRVKDPSANGVYRHCITATISVLGLRFDYTADIVTASVTTFKPIDVYEYITGRKPSQADGCIININSTIYSDDTVYALSMIARENGRLKAYIITNGNELKADFSTESIDKVYDIVSPL